MNARRLSILGCSALALVAYGFDRARLNKKIDELRIQTADSQPLTASAPAVTMRPIVINPVVVKTTEATIAHRDVVTGPPEAPGASTAPLSLAEFHAPMQAAFDRQNVDPNWAASSESKIYTSIAKVLGESTTIRSVSCRTTICRMELEHPDEAEFRSFLGRYTGERFWPGEIAGGRLKEEPDGRVVTAIYMGKVGTPLPSQSEGTASEAESRGSR